MILSNYHKSFQLIGLHIRVLDYHCEDFEMKQFEIKQLRRQLQINNNLIRIFAVIFLIYRGFHADCKTTYLSFWVG